MAIIEEAPILQKPKKDESKIKLTRLMKLPLRLLGKAKDFYVQSITECSAQFDCNALMGCPSNAQLSRSLSTTSTTSTATTNNEDFRELVRASSARTTQQLSPMAGPNAVARSQSVGVIGRIDEEKPCESFEDEEGVKVVKRNVYPRSRSAYAVSRRINNNVS